MDRLLINGGTKLHGKVTISGSKNAALPCLAASLLTKEPITLHNLPNVTDIRNMIQVLKLLGCDITKHSYYNEYGISTTIINNISKYNKLQAPYDLVKTMRASILVLGPTLAHFHRASVSLPGGCAIGTRPINLHLEALEHMGAIIKIDRGYVEAYVPTGRLKAINHVFKKTSVGASENIIMAATLADGITTLHNVAIEPEISDLIDMLTTMGAKIYGKNTPKIIVEGVKSLHGGEHTIIPDRIEIGTFLCAVAATSGDITIENIKIDHLNSILDVLQQCGCTFTKEFNHDKLNLRVQRDSNQKIYSTDIITNPYPGFPTDLQAQIMTVMTQAQGISVIKETIFENRFQHAMELERLGANLRINDNTAIITGPTNLIGCNVMATDLRASASLVIAGLIAHGTTIIDRIYHLDRGYANLEKKLNELGANIDRIGGGKV